MTTDNRIVIPVTLLGHFLSKFARHDYTGGISHAAFLRSQRKVRNTSKWDCETVSLYKAKKRIGTHPTIFKDVDYYKSHNVVHILKRMIG